MDDLPGDGPESESAKLAEASAKTSAGSKLLSCIQGHCMIGGALWRIRICLRSEAGLSCDPEE